ncbi:MAG: primosomal protein N' [Deferribacteraceae bacterium]|jgi:primosomal protein N' (replication factor Y)|nr:primosomal protein N' [Deferribacteraceae bacterium]
MKFFEVLLPIAADGVFTYSSHVYVLPGARAAVRFNNRDIVGIVLGEAAEPAFHCSEISMILDELPLFDLTWLNFLKEIAEYYLTPLGSTLFGVLSTKILASYPPKRPYEPKLTTIAPIELSAEQKAVLDEIPPDSPFCPHLIHGVTGSGKTEIYIELIKKVIQMGKQVLYLVPEISLTPQLFSLLSARLGYTIPAFHFRVGYTARSAAFWRFARGEASLIVGARSALFIPPKNLGMIILDEEHEKSYKQEETPSYHLRDMAVLYAKLRDIPIVLGSATPQTETIANAYSGKYLLHRLPHRVFGAAMPSFNIIDMKKEQYPKKFIAEPIIQELAKTVEQDQQAIIFLNRKGYAASLYCKVCGTVQYCPNCSVPYTVYKNGNLVCNYCGSFSKYTLCPICGASETSFAGVGTERIEEYLDEIFPNEIIRIDADKVRSTGKLTELLDDFGSKKAHILVGTQFIAKGLHFPDLTFVGILGIDNILSLPDFRAVERGYQLIAQISGRAGREKKCGLIHIQTLIPEHPIFNVDMYNSQSSFYDYELPRREKFVYPPYTKLCRLLFAGSDEDKTRMEAFRVCETLKREFTDIALLGPVQAPIARLNKLYRYTALIKSNSNKNIVSLIKQSRMILKKEKTDPVSIRVDRDPYYFM